MSPTRLARRYADALMTSAEELGVVAQVAGDLRQLESLLAGSREFRLFLESPVIKTEKKQDTLHALFDGKLQPLTLRLLLLMTEKGREAVLPVMIAEFFHRQDEREGVVEVGVRAASALTPEQTAQLTRRFEAVSKKKVRIAFSLDAALRGGFLARIGDTVFDGSVRRQLELLRDRLIREPQN
jgi:F-type H+-transporting ATPase subunit delta